MASKTVVDEGEFPILCETCLGPNPYIRMLEDKHGRECKVCERPFRSYSWRPGGHGMRKKKTEICQTCARIKNVCQTCILDLKYNVPVAIRDLTIPKADRLATIAPNSEATREYNAAQHDRLLATTGVDAVYSQPAPDDSVAVRAQRDAPRYERNRARVCGLYAKGKCTRGLYCPYRHEKVDDEEAGATNRESDQNLRDRYYGQNDPVAQRLIQKVCGNRADPQALEVTGNAPPENKAIRTLFIGGVTPDLSEAKVREFFREFGVVENINLIPGRGIGFVDFDSREEAEKAMSNTYGSRTIGSVPVSIKWGRSTITRRPRPVELLERESKRMKKSVH